MPAPQPLEDRFWKYACPDPNTGCWHWAGAIYQGGYAAINLGAGKNGKIGYGHRVSYEMFNGKIPEGKEIDHLCRNRSCVNPDHLEAVTHKVNARRGLMGELHKKKTHCPRGHPYSGSNLYVAPSGSPVCKTCRRVRRKK